MGEIDNMGVLNHKYGVCGFASSLYALYTRSPSSGLAAGASVETRMMAEIKTYLMMLKAEGRSDLLSDIKTFTTSFPKYESFTIDGYITEINAAVKGGIPNFSIAMPPNAVVDYLKRACDFKNAKEVPLTDTSNELILGVRDGKGKSEPLKGLIHWVYFQNKIVYSWGVQFAGGSEAASVAAAGKSQKKDYQVVYKISPGG
jgi:hypothetical protein